MEKHTALLSLSIPSGDRPHKGTVLWSLDVFFLLLLSRITVPFYTKWWPPAQRDSTVELRCLLFRYPALMFLSIQNGDRSQKGTVLWSLDVFFFGIPNYCSFLYKVVTFRTKGRYCGVYVLCSSVVFSVVIPNKLLYRLSCFPDYLRPQLCTIPAGDWLLMCTDNRCVTLDWLLCTVCRQHLMSSHVLRAAETGNFNQR